MAIRRVPIKSILQKAPRIVRDIASASGKEIDVSISGEDVEIDKSLIEALEAPLVHMVRNTADHGIEPPDERIKANKSRRGTVSITVMDLPDFIELKISDDGKGIDFSAVRKKAELLELIAPGQKMSEDELTNLLFVSGVSTAKKITDVSGRGVGMDIVKRSIEKVGGKISVGSVPGRGTDFIIEIPKTIGTQIISGFLVRVGEQRFVVPLDNIVEAFNPNTVDFTSIGGKGMCVRRRDRLMPFLSSSDIFGLQSEGSNKKRDTTVITINHNNQMYGFGVDDILGLLEVVAKPVDGLYQERTLFTGAAVTGSGEVSMIVDIDNIFNCP